MDTVYDGKGHALWHIGSLYTSDFFSAGGSNCFISQCICFLSLLSAIYEIQSDQYCIDYNRHTYTPVCD